eukprot:5595152-Pleurochrysis_carterae.AAC.1
MRTRQSWTARTRRPGLSLPTWAGSATTLLPLTSTSVSAMPLSSATSTRRLFSSSAWSGSTSSYSRTWPTPYKPWGEAGGSAGLDGR